MKRIAIIDDHTLIRKSLMLFIQGIPSLEVVFDTDDGNALLTYLSQHEVDLILLDLQMPKMDGFTLCQLIRQQFQDVKILALSQLMTQEVIYRLIKSGANGYISKISEPEQFKHAIEKVMKFDYFFNAPLSELLINTVSLKRTDKADLPKTTADIISSREREILILTARGYTSEEIAAQLCLSVRTIDSHKRSLIYKTGCYNIIGAIVICLTEFIISLDEIKFLKK
jgi:DNA-binding NarL/FixJ family response regulator